MKKNKILSIILLAVIIGIVGGKITSNHLFRLIDNYDNSNSKNDIEETVSDSECMKKPTQEQIIKKRKECLAGMSNEDIQFVVENIKKANLSIEHEYIYNNLFQKLSNPNDPYWNYIDIEGEIIIGYAFEDDVEYDEKMDMTYEEFCDKYGSPVYDDNKYNYKKCIEIINIIQDKVKSNVLDEDFGKLKVYEEKAHETHKISYIEKVYYILHDMDYYFFRYDSDDLRNYPIDDGIIDQYYGYLSVFGD
ncbi:hypothetical protein SAMN05216390_10755 [Lachnospiraceae bacterium KH1T2]|nr:hypothetical protein SAMN05216390_10755 [Lachnospiraceae bacterium KH1T2]